MRLLKYGIYTDNDIRLVSFGLFPSFFPETLWVYSLTLRGDYIYLIVHCRHVYLSGSAIVEFHPISLSHHFGDANKDCTLQPWLKFLIAQFNLEPYLKPRARLIHLIYTPASR